MFDRFRRRNRAAPLTGAPAAPREKTYSARSGYVYRYTYRGRRLGEYEFEVAAGPKTSFPVSVVVSEEPVDAWEQARGRSLTATERYAIAKMALFQAFDERLRPAEMRHPVHVRAADLDAILESLGID